MMINLTLGPGKEVISESSVPWTRLNIAGRTMRELTSQQG